ncbi:MAG TPA: aryl-sulfate sulfotransferase [Candidatus Eisenbacteria bacterium]
MRSSPPSISFAILALIASFGPPAAAAPRAFLYLSPVPGADKVSRWNNLVIRQASALDPASLDARRLSVVGGESGPHAGRLRLASDGQTILFTPDQPYALGERVRVRLAAGTRTLAGTTLPELAYEFRVSTVDPRLMPRPASERMPDPPADNPSWLRPGVAIQDSGEPCDTLLPGFPALHLVNVSNSQPGVFFIAPWVLGPSNRADFEIMDDRGQPLYEASYDANSIPFDFKVQPDGRLSFWMNGAFKFLVLDSAYARVDSFTTGNGYSPDLHDLQILPNGHALIMSYDPEPVGMDTVVSGGNPNCIVIGLIVQELDENKDVVFQWRSWDHFKITDARSSPDINLLASGIDYVHGNSVEMMPDGNLLISSRHLNELTKIDRQSGAVLWRMGLNALNNMFKFPNETRGWSHQHDARVQPNGHLTLFDNGNNLSPRYSRALEFVVDEQNFVATKVWEYRHVPDVYGGFMGNVQVHPDGGVTIGWGGTFSNPQMTDLLADGTIAAELQFPSGLVNYRAFRFPWRTNRILTDRQSMDIGAPAVGSSGVMLLKVWNHWNQTISIDCLRTTDSTFSATLVSGPLPVTLAPDETTLVQVTYSPVEGGAVDSRLYVVQQSSSEMVAQSVVLHGHIDSNVGVDPAPGLLLTAKAGPNPLHEGTTIEFTLPSAGPVQLDVFDVGGRTVATLVDETRAAGRHTVRWSAVGRRSGLYIYRLRVAGQSIVRKLVVLG